MLTSEQIRTIHSEVNAASMEHEHSPVSDWPLENVLYNLDVTANHHDEEFPIDKDSYFFVNNPQFLRLCWEVVLNRRTRCSSTTKTQNIT